MQRLEDDFYTHINAEWLENNKIPSEYTKWSNFHILNKTYNYPKVIMQY